MPAEPPSRRRDVKSALLEGAAACLAERGYLRTTARDIAAASGANLRSIGYHYGSVDGLLTAALSTNFRRWLAPLIEAADDHDDPAARLADGLDRFARSLPGNAALVRAWVEAVGSAEQGSERHDRLAANQAWFRGRLADTLAGQGQEAPDDLAAAIITVCDGLMVRFLLHGAAPTPARLAADAARGLAGLETGGRRAGG